ncbi:MAG: hypothetical protein B7Y36_18350 [Novosphingobium sp. 28-62-57]|nr:MULTISPECIES: hypothetical protein [unclassified Novosphingobium]OYW47330.1 MAG: hypothetical protein B7Z36_03960 [Novosphingobium sp. 12-63-9]OYZ07998.1 MAG: hypothetical protein B7Y36_18350 [Novosphingobium sp. 28-62-57]OYZ97827.1 MAG: hypothetical protein B7X96_01880 [Novosphingobium sp. 17-62-8]
MSLRALLPSWPPRDWRAFAALVFSVAGAVVLTAFVWWGVAQLLPAEGWTEKSEVNRATTIRWTLWIAMGSIGLVLLGLGFAVTPRKLKTKDGDRSFEFSGGDTDKGEE